MNRRHCGFRACHGPFDDRRHRHLARRCSIPLKSKTHRLASNSGGEIEREPNSAMGRRSGGDRRHSVWSLGNPRPCSAGKDRRHRHGKRGSKCASLQTRRHRNRSFGYAVSRPQRCRLGRDRQQRCQEHRENVPRRVVLIRLNPAWAHSLPNMSDFPVWTDSTGVFRRTHGARADVILFPPTALISMLYPAQLLGLIHLSDF
jgi:hypothetical protein